MELGLSRNFDTVAMYAICLYASLIENIDTK